MMTFATLWILACLRFPQTAQEAGDTLAEVDGVAITSEEVEREVFARIIDDELSRAFAARGGSLVAPEDLGYCFG
jgi:hypothetical protein